VDTVVFRDRYPPQLVPCAQAMHARLEVQRHDGLRGLVGIGRQQIEGQRGPAGRLPFQIQPCQAEVGIDATNLDHK
jgi:hypothetical protein